MRIKIQQFLFGKCHSWSIVGQNIGRALIKKGHIVDFVSTDGIIDQFIPEDLKPYVKEKPIGLYDCQISYTAPSNWQNYLVNGNKNRFGIWNYEYNLKPGASNILLPKFINCHKYVDLILPSSTFTKEVFKNIKYPENKMVVVPHGINIDDFTSNNKYNLKTKKSNKILLNIAQPHKRKAIPLALKSFGKAFSKNDDVCLVVKILKKNKQNQQFDVDFDQLYRTFERDFPNHAEVEFVYDYITNISEIYKACDFNFSATHTECWHLPSLEALASGIINIVPKYGGILDFCNEHNSLLINGKIVRAPTDHQYWDHNAFCIHFEIDTDHAASLLQEAINKKISLVKTFSENMKTTAQKYTWDNAADQILSLCK